MNELVRKYMQGMSPQAIDNILKQEFFIKAWAECFEVFKMRADKIDEEDYMVWAAKKACRFWPNYLEGSEY